MKKINFIIGFLYIILVSTCSNSENETPSIEPNVDVNKPNILLIIADDMSKDATSGFSEGVIKPNTPHINSLKNTGISFNNFWVYPTCSPTRASIITGKYGFRTNVNWAGDVLSSSETILQSYINQQTNNAYDTTLVGKWHLSGSGNTISNPETLGIDYYAGLYGGGVQNYEQWQLTEDGAVTTQTQYITEKFTDLAIDRIESQDNPWFLWLAYNAPHTPFHAPPSNMHSQGNLPEYTAGMDALPYYLAAIEAMDFQIGRLLESIPEDERANTIIIFMGDNGTPNQVAQSPYSNSTVKGSIYQGGINTPLFVSGHGVTRSGQEDDNLINSTDLFATIAQIAGSATSEIHDSKSFQSLFTESLNIRDFQYSELNNGANHRWALSNGTYKLFVDANGNQELYNLISDPYENTNLLLETLNTTQQTAVTELENELLEIRQ